MRDADLQGGQGIGQSLAFGVVQVQIHWPATGFITDMAADVGYGSRVGHAVVSAS